MIRLHFWRRPLSQARFLKKKVQRPDSLKIPFPDEARLGGQKFEGMIERIK
jgi:hypothetical protein